MNKDAALPPPMAEALGRVCGTYVLERAGGMSTSSVLRVRAERADFALKRNVAANELAFYLKNAPRLRDEGVDTPAVVGHAADENEAWLLLEWIPQPLPRARWGPDPQVLRTLVALHHAEAPAELADGFVPAWTSELTERALTHLEPADRGGVARALDHHRAIALPLLTGTRPISGDPNPRNWAMRADGRPVLFDWERFALATPQFDLGILLPGLPQRSDAERMAQAYTREAGSTTGVAELAEQLVAIKAWSVVELLAEPPRPALAEIHRWLGERVPRWLAVTA